ncbi:MAG: tRNA (N(6)-L-threonylcarbamoyladenosine(37)-C(2))-methylthiotransferase MtaB, partial [Lachnospiraceae bacterium]|nr:tRNA (N(6)-L-threonylcarbamoyladenosine(37)-C(2))-methylthiotransferase MtaB [Lachnospiraceae bacterium]
MRKAALHNLGCKVNAYETEAMQQLLEAAGYEIVSFQDPADVYVINTCSVTNVADRKSRQMLHRAKNKNPDAVVVAAGCYVQAAAEELKKDLSVDIIIGNNKKKDLVPILDAYFAEREGNTEEAQACVEVIPIGETHEYEELH